MIKENLNIAYLQCNIVWEQTSYNLHHYSQIVQSAGNEIDILVLPEMFHCGFTMQPHNVAQRMDGEVVLWMKAMAQKHECAIAGSVVIVEDEQYFNRFLFVEPSGKIHHYNKRHLFRMGGENNVYSSGNERKVINYKGWRILPLICYDLRFPVFSRNKNDYDLAIYVANWPTPRVEVWDVLLKARAIENQCYVLGVNRTGEDKAVAYCGHSVLYGARGQQISFAGNKAELLQMDSISLIELQDFKKKFPAYLDADEFELL